VQGDEGASVTRSSNFQAANCADLPFGPKLSLKLTGGVQRLGHPAIHAVLKAGSGEANLSRVQVTLPSGELLDNSHFGAVCTRVRFAAHNCPESSLVGTAKVVTPLLDKPLSGNAYLRSSSHGLPDVALDLQGQFDIETAARINSVNGGLRATFEGIPDAPVSEIELNVLGGSKGLLRNSESLCARPKAAEVVLTGQNGAVSHRRSGLNPACRKGSGGDTRNKSSREGR
jgi:hypothetical protein